MTDLFQFSEKETAPTTPASPSNIAAVEPEQPEPKAVATDQPSQIAPDNKTVRQIVSKAPTDPSRASAPATVERERVSPIEDPKRLKQLNDAVWAGLGRVKAAITAGASISAVNELGVRPVDMAVDRGHYEIAHYLLSVENQRRDAATQEPEPTPAERMVARSVMPAPTSSLPEPGRVRESAVTRQPTPKLCRLNL